MSAQTPRPSARPAAPPAAPPPAPSATPPYETRTPEQHFEALVAELNIPRQLALAIKEQESGRRPFQSPGGPVLTSAQNARGWFQVLPETAAAYKLDTNDPFQNIEAGLRNIKEALDKNHNDPDLAARYYHGGSDRAQWGPLTEQYGVAVGQRLRALLAADGGQATPEATPEATPRRRPGDIRVPTAAESKAATQSTTDPKATPPVPPWYAPEQLLTTAKDLGVGVLKGAGQTATNLGRLPHLIPGVSSAIDYLYGTPGLSAQAFPATDEKLRPSNTTQTVGKVGEQIAEAIIPAGAITRSGLAASSRVAGAVAPGAARTLARYATRAAVEGTGAAGLAAAQGQDPTTAAGIAAAVPVAGAVLRAPFSGRLTPVAQRAVDFGRAHGVPIDAATATANKWVRNIQTGLENTPLGAAVRARVERVRGDRMSRLGEDLANQVHPTAITPAEAGQGVADALDARVTGLRGAARTAYQDAEALAADPAHLQSVPTGKLSTPTTPGRGVSGPATPVMVDMALPVDVRPIRASLKPMLDQLLAQPLAQQQASPALPALQRLFSGGPFRPLLDLEADLGAIKQLANASGGLRNRSQGVAAQGVKALQGAIDRAAATADPALLAALRRGRTLTATQHAADRLRTKVLGTAKERQARGTEPMRPYTQLTQADDLGIARLRTAALHVPKLQRAQLGRAFLQDLLETATAEGGYKHAARVANAWDRLGTQTKALLYQPTHIAALDNFFQLGRQLAEHPNPSRSGVFGWSNLSTMLAAGSFGKYPLGTLGAVGGTGALTQLLNSDMGVRLLTEGLTVPGGSPAAAVWIQQVQQLLDTDQRPSNTPPPRPPARQGGGLDGR